MINVGGSAKILTNVQTFRDCALHQWNVRYEPLYHYTMFYEYVKRTRDFGGGVFIFFKFSLLYFLGVFNKTIIPLALLDIR